MEENLEKNNTAFIITLIVIFIIIIALSVGIVLYTLSVKEKTANKETKVETENEKEADKEILILQDQTSYYSEDTSKYNKYIIKNAEDLQSFRIIHPLSPNIEKSFLNNRTLFVLIKVEGSGSINHKLLNATIKNGKVDFNIITNHPEIGTTDMATWYFIASVPNEKLEGLDLTEWFKPKDVQAKINATMSDV